MVPNLSLGSAAGVSAKQGFCGIAADRLARTILRLAQDRLLNAFAGILAEGDIGCVVPARPGGLLSASTPVSLNSMSTTMGPL